jgi:hypothetical protein
VTFNVVLRTIYFDSNATDKKKRRDLLEIVRLVSENHIAPDRLTIHVMKHLTGVKQGGMKRPNLHGPIT